MSVDSAGNERWETDNQDRHEAWRCEDLHIHNGVLYAGFWEEYDDEGDPPEHSFLFDARTGRRDRAIQFVGHEQRDKDRLEGPEFLGHASRPLWWDDAELIVLDDFEGEGQVLRAIDVRGYEVPPRPL